MESCIKPVVRLITKQQNAINTRRVVLVSRVSPVAQTSQLGNINFLIKEFLLIKCGGKYIHYMIRQNHSKLITFINQSFIRMTRKKHVLLKWGIIWVRILNGKLWFLNILYFNIKLRGLSDCILIWLCL